MKYQHTHTHHDGHSWTCPISHIHEGKARACAIEYAERRHREHLLCLPHKISVFEKTREAKQLWAGEVRVEGHTVITEFDNVDLPQWYKNLQEKDDAA